MAGASCKASGQEAGRSPTIGDEVRRAAATAGWRRAAFQALRLFLITPKYRGPSQQFRAMPALNIRGRMTGKARSKIMFRLTAGVA